MTERIIYRMFKYAIDILEERNAPGWLRNHPEIKSRNNVAKSFENFGISSFRDKYLFQDAEERVEIKKQAATTLANLWQSLTEELEEQGITDPDVLEFHTILDMLIEILERYGAGENFTLYKDVKFGKYKFGKGQKLTRIYTAIYKEAYRLAKEKNLSVFVPALDHIPTIKALNELNKSDEYYVVFNSGSEGSWDVCTMSERGISSCQSWDRDPTYRDNLIGSVLSRNIGVIYFTNQNKLDKGEQMLYRSLIRIILSDGKPIIIIDQMYKHHSDQVMKFFIESLSKRSSIPIYDAQNMPEKAWITKRKDLVVDKLDSAHKPYDKDTEIREFTSGVEIKHFQRKVVNSVFDNLGDLEYSINEKNGEFITNIRKYINIAINDIIEEGILEIAEIEDETPEDEKRVIQEVGQKAKVELKKIRDSKKYLQSYNGTPNFSVEDAIDYANAFIDLYLNSLNKALDKYKN